MEGKEAFDLFHSYNQKYFWGKLDKVRLSWSKKLTLCAGKTTGKVRRGSSLCSISLSEPLLSQRPRQDTINILLHEMIHAYLFLTEGASHKMGHGPQFKEHMNRINTLQGCKITVCHNFRKEVDKFRVHVYRCDGPCTKKQPYFGVVRRAVTRPPGPTDKWWVRHNQECGGTYRKVEGPDISPDTPTTHKLLKASRTAASPGTPSPKFTPSPRKMDPSKSQSSGATVKSGRSDGSKFISDKSKRLSSGQEENRGDPTYSKDHLIQKIKKRHAHTSRSILLSKKETNMKWRGRTPEAGTLVDGRVNYNYKIKSGFKFDINKYLERYRAVKEAGARTTCKNEGLQNPQASLNTQKFTKHQVTVPHTSKRREAASVSYIALDDEPRTSVNPEAGGSSHAPAVACWNCGVNVMVPRRAQDSQKVRKESACDIPKSAPPRRKEDLGKSLSSTLVPCPSCAVKLPMDELNSHLDQCLIAFTDDF